MTPKLFPPLARLAFNIRFFLYFFCLKKIVGFHFYSENTNIWIFVCPRIFFFVQTVVYNSKVLLSDECIGKTNSQLDCYLLQTVGS